MSRPVFRPRLFRLRRDRWQSVAVGANFALRPTFEALEDRSLLAIDFSLTSGARVYQQKVEGGVYLQLSQPALAMTEPAASPLANGSGSLDIQLQKSPALLANAQASAAFDRAAAFWESILFDPITVNIDADFTSLPPGVLGGTLPVDVSIGYDALRNLIIADAQQNETFLTQIPTLAQLTLDLPVDAANPFTLGGAKASRPNLKALGVAEAALPSNPSQYNPAVNADISMAFSTAFSWDFDPTNGISAGAFDFVGVAIHEIGHGLGFLSTADDVDFLLGNPDQGRSLEIYPLDYFRLRPGAGGSSFTTSARVLNTAGDAVTYDGGIYNPVGFAIAGLQLGDIPMSTGNSTGDGNQGSHWKADDSTGVTIGVMDPTLAPGQLGIFSTQDARAFGLIGWDLIDPLPDVTLNVFGASHFEGNSGVQDFVFIVTASGTIEQEFSVQYGTVDGTATAATDYTAAAGELTFTPGGPTQQSITISVNGDLQIENNESFLLRLSNPTEPGVLGVSEALGQILNDDLGFRVSDASVLENNAVGRNAVFSISTFGVVDRSVSVSYTTLNLTATAGSDYQPRAGAVTFAPGGGVANVTVPIIADLFNESTETFKLLLLNPQGGRILDEEGIATILDDDPIPGLYINDVNLTTTESGALAAIFTVALDAPSGQNVSVNVATSDNTAFSGLDYQAQNGLLQFAPGVTTQAVTVPVLTSDLYAPNKTFLVNLYGVVNARLADSQGIGRIIFAAPPVGELILDNGDAGFSHSGGWTNLTNTLSYGLDYEYHSAGNGSGQATWSFGNLPTGAYEVFAKWIPFSNRATNAPYTVLDGGATLGTVLVNQQQFPTGEQSNGITWQSLGFFSTSTGTLNVRLNDNANGLVVADAIRLVKDGISLQTPEMDVASFGRSIGAGDVAPALEDGTDFGVTASLTNSLTRTFTISNTGNAALSLSGSPRVQIAGLHPQDFTVVAQPAAIVAAGQTTTFQIMFDPTALGLRQAIVSIANNDDSEQPYTFMVQGVGASPGPASWIIDDAGAGFAAQGAWNTNFVGSAYQGQLATAAAGNGGATAQWMFAGLSPGKYDVYSTWAPQADRATAAPFTVADSGGSHYTLNINQRQAPNIPINGTNWGTLGSIDISSGTLSVRMTNAANGTVAADAVMVVRHDAPQQPGTLLAHNAAMPLDVNGDSNVSSFDALLVISSLLSNSASPQAVPLTSGAGYYTDVTGDGQVSPRDALLVISHLLASPLAAPQAMSSVVALAAADSGAPESAAPGTTDLSAIDTALSQLADSDAPLDEPLFVAVALEFDDSDEPTAPRIANPWAVATVFAEADAEDAEDEADSLLLVLSE